MIKIIAFALACLLLILPSDLHAQQTIGGACSESVRKFVQDFYDWYVPYALHDNSGPASDIALTLKPRLFSAELVRKLKQDSDAQAKAQDLVGLDFDPFLSGQDPATHYMVTGMKHSGSAYLVNITSAIIPKRGQKPDVIAKVTARNGHWVFVDFLYPGEGDLLGVLKALKRDREKPPSPQ